MNKADSLPAHDITTLVLPARHAGTGVFDVLVVEEILLVVIVIINPRGC